MLRIMLLVTTLLLSSVAFCDPSGKGLTELKKPVQAPDFSLLDVDGNEHKLSAYQGKVVIVSFWATWCPPCRAEMPSMQRAWEKLKNDDVIMLGINVGEDEDTIFAFTGSFPVEFPLLMDQDSAVIKKWPVVGLPTSFVLDTKGKIVYRAIGAREWDAPELISKIKTLKK